MSSGTRARLFPALIADPNRDLMFILDTSKTSTFDAGCDIFMELSGTWLKRTGRRTKLYFSNSDEFHEVNDEAELSTVFNEMVLQGTKLDTKNVANFIESNFVRWATNSTRKTTVFVIAARMYIGHKDITNAVTQLQEQLARSSIPRDRVQFQWVKLDS